MHRLTRFFPIPVLSLRIVEPALKDLRRQGVDIEDILTEAGVTPEILENLDLLLPAYIINTIAAISAERSGVPWYFSDLATRIHSEAWIPVQAGPGRSLTLGDFLMRVCARSGELGTALSLSLLMEDGNAIVVDRQSGKTAWSTAHLDAFVVSLILSKFRRSLGLSLDRNRLLLRVGDHRLLIPELRALGALSGDGIYVRFPSDWLSLPYGAQPALSEDSRDAVRSEELDFAQVTRNYLALVVGKTETLAIDLASACGVTERELRDELTRLGTSPKELIDDAKRDYALAALAAGAKSATRIALDLGYSSVATFSRSFKRWTGESPREFQRRRIVKRALHQPGAERNAHHPVLLPDALDPDAIGQPDPRPEAVADRKLPLN